MNPNSANVTDVNTKKKSIIKPLKSSIGNPVGGGSYEMNFKTNKSKKKKLNFKKNFFNK